MNPRDYHCEYCEATAEDTVLLKFPFTVLYKDLETSHSNVVEESYVCLSCVGTVTVEDYHEKE